MKQAAIGVFDSGVGGLTVVRALKKLLPHETILYLGDTARVPYGTKSRETVQRYSVEAMQFLEVAARELGQRNDQTTFFPESTDIPGLKLVIIACNTASAFALQALRQHCTIPVLGVIRSAVWQAMQVTRKKTIGIIGTEGTVRSGAYQQAIHAEDPGVDVTALPCSLLVPLVEEGWLEHPVTDLTIQTYLQPLQGRIDTLILGCTHYPLLRSALDRFFAGQVHLVEPSESVAQEALLLLQKRGWLSTSSTEGELMCFVTDTPQRFQQIANRFLGGNPQHVEQVDLMKYVRGKV